MSLAFSVAGFVITFKAAQTLVPEYIYSIFFPDAFSLTNVASIFVNLGDTYTKCH